ncbi:hypothetical protein UFOVP1229_160 [uncultured Caudovirales phage]|uniref:Uncharacterized protein n=1 Tax=uncultured Caudovirales phage TaxID=2100421 RepID=A0A6J5RDS3_9CAUD|nr:hypothetical protein UFOVP1229_160 [uncultured Caudovirales phage]
MNTIKTEITIRLLSSDSGRTVEMSRDVEFPGFMPLGYRFEIAGRLVGNVVYCGYDAGIGCVFAGVGSSIVLNVDLMAEDIPDESEFLTIVSHLVAAGFSIDLDDVANEDEASTGDIISGNAESTYAPGWEKE